MEGDDDQGDTEVDERAQKLLEGQHHLHYLTAVGKAGGPEAQYDARRDPDQQAEGQALKDTVHR